MPPRVTQLEISPHMKMLVTALLALATLGVSACNTVEGLGRDVSSVGRTVEGVAQ
jgi:predicted small secreted protein